MHGTISPLRLTVLLLGGLATLAPASGQRFEDQTATRFPTATNDYTNQITLGDLEGDGDLDIFFANGGGFVSEGSPEPLRILVNDGAGNFTDESTTRLNFSGLCRGAELGDIDRDGDLDLICAQDFDRQPELFRNDAGSFVNVTASGLPQITLSSSRAQFADLDNDGDLDLYIASGEEDRFSCGQNRIYANDGTGSFTDRTATLHPTEILCENMDVTIGDVDGDFDLDVVVGNRDGSSRLYRNNGAGMLSASSDLPADSRTYSYDFGDVDGDGDLDLLGANSRSGSSGEALFLNNGSGVFTDASAQISPNPNFDDDNDSKFFDYDDDGDLDLIIAQLGGNAEKIYSNDGSGNFTQVTGEITAIGDSSLDIMVGDLTGDGRLDIVTGQGESGSFTNRIYVNVGSESDTRAPRIIATETFVGNPGPGPWAIRAAILDDMSSDRNFFDDGIFLDYRADGGPTLTLPMVHSGGQIYRAEIPADAGSLITYSVRASDAAGNEAIGNTEMLSAALVFTDGFESGTVAAWSSSAGS